METDIEVTKHLPHKLLAKVPWGPSVASVYVVDGMLQLANLFGWCDKQSWEIYIDGSLDDGRFFQTAVHELTHLAISESGIEMDEQTEEILVRSISTYLAQALPALGSLKRKGKK